MDKRKIATVAWIFLAVACFIMGVLTLAGVFSRTDATGRFLIGFGWVLIGVGWLGRYFVAKKKWEQDSKDDRPRRGEGEL